ncbi:MAG: response regulator [bacterium]|nr:response regulator [bacterium]
MTLSLILRMAGYDVTVAADGKEALEMLLAAENGNHPMDLLVTDIHMPGLTGLQLMAELEKREIHCPTLVISGLTDARAMVQATQQQYTHFLEKPFEPQELVLSTELVLEKKQYRHV